MRRRPVRQQGMWLAVQGRAQEIGRAVGWGAQEAWGRIQARWVIRGRGTGRGAWEDCNKTDELFAWAQGVGAKARGQG